MSELQPLIEQLTGDAGRDGITKLVVGAIVHSGGQVLTVRRSAADPFMPGIDELPSGGVDDGEDLLDALARELAEEIGWTGASRAGPSFAGTFDYLSGSGRKTRQFTFALAHDGTPITLSSEHSAHRWIDPADLDGTGLTDETAQTIRDWAAGLG